MTNLVTLLQRMDPHGSGGNIVVTQPRVGLTAQFDSIDEGATLGYTVTRLSTLGQPFSIDWRVISAGGSDDLVNPTTGTLNFLDNENAKSFVVDTFKRVGDQGDRIVTANLQNPVGCDIDPVDGGPVQTMLKNVADVIVQPPPGDPPLARYVPRATRTIFVANKTQLTNALAGNFSGLTTSPTGIAGPLKAGDHIVARDGTYVGDITLPVMVNADHITPCVLEAENVIGAKIQGNITITGSGRYLVGFDITGGGKVVVTGTGTKNCRVSRNRIAPIGKGIEVQASCSDIIVDCNEIIPNADNTQTGQAIEMLAAANINNIVELNYIHDQPTRTDKEAIRTGSNLTGQGLSSGIRIQYNYIVNWSADIDEVISGRSGGCTFQGNTIVGGTGDFMHRGGENCKFLGNWIEGPRNLVIFDTGHQVISNFVADPAHKLALGAGDCNWNNFPANADPNANPPLIHPNFANSTVADYFGVEVEVGSVDEIGTPPTTFSAEINTIYVDDAQLVKTKEINNIYHSAASYTGTKYPVVQLAISDVGLDAPAYIQDHGDFIELTPANGSNITTLLMNLKTDPAGKTYRLPDNSTFFGKNIFMANGVKLSGHGPNTVIKLPDHTYNENVDGAGLISVFKFGVNAHNDSTTIGSNCALMDMTIDGNKKNQTFVSELVGTENGGWHGVRIGGTAKKVTLDRVICKNCGTDGLSLGNTATDCAFTDCTFNNNRRMGFFISAGVRNTLLRCKCLRNGDSDTDGDGHVVTGHDPRAGVDIEPNSDSDDVIDLVFDDCDFTNNDGAGFTSESRSDHTPDLTRLVVRNCRSSGNGDPSGVKIHARAGQFNDALITGCTFTTKVQIGGASHEFCKHVNTIFENNKANSVTVLYLKTGSSVTIRNNNLDNGNASVTFDNVQNTGNVTISGNT